MLNVTPRVAPVGMVSKTRSSTNVENSSSQHRAAAGVELFRASAILTVRNEWIGEINDLVAGNPWSQDFQSGCYRSGQVGRFVCLLLNVPATGYCISGTDLLRQFYVLPHWDRSCRSNVLPHPVTVYWHRADQFQRWHYNARRLTG